MNMIEHLCTEFIQTHLLNETPNLFKVSLVIYSIVIAWVVGGQHSNDKEVTQWNLSNLATKQTIYNFIVWGQKRRKLPVIMSSSKQEMSSFGLILK